MNWAHRKFAFFATTALSLGLVAPAMAQEEEIIVTARRVEERLQDVPISITVFNQKQLSDRNIVNASDLAAYTPNLSVNTRYSSDTTSFAIRGFTQEVRTTASVGVYFADVVAPRAGQPIVTAGDGAGPGSFFDLQNVQVLKGPQGTLFGRNTTGGAVLLVPQKPKGEFGGYVEGSYGNFNMKRLQAVLNVPLGSKARLRVGFDRMTQDGYLNNISGIGPAHFGNTNYIAGRASLVVDVTPDIENYTIASLTNSDNNGYLQQIFVVDPTKANAGTLNGAGLLPQVARLNQSKDFYQVENSLADPNSWLQQWQLINTTTWHATDLFTVKNITSYSVIRQNLQQDFYGSNVQGPFGPQPVVDIRADPHSHSADQYNITEELQLQGRSANSKLSWQFGVYYEQSTPRAVSVGRVPVNGAICPDVNNGTPPQCIGTTVQAAVASASAAGRFRNMGIYGQGTYAILDNLKLTAGMRFTHDETSGIGGETIYALYPSAAPAGPPGFTTCDAAVTGFGCHIRQRVTSDAPTWLLDLEYSPIQDLMAYVKYSRGYRQGAVNSYAPKGFDTFLPETVEVYEIGTKSTFHGKVPGTFNVAVFYNDFAQQQLDFSLVSSGGLPQSTAIRNAGTSRMYGAEIEASLRPFRDFRLDASAAYLSTKILSERKVAGNNLYDFVIPTSIEGGPLPYSPKYKATVTGTYTLPIPESIGIVQFAATYAFQAAYSTFAPIQILADGTQVPVPFSRVDRTNLVNLNLNWLGIAGGPVDASFFVTNLFDETYVQTASGTLPALGYDSRVLGTPRMFGARLKLRFGADARG